MTRTATGRPDGGGPGERYVPEVDILGGMDFAVREGEIVTVIGPNGAGKSTLIKSIFVLPRAGVGWCSAVRISRDCCPTQSPAGG